MQERYPSDLQHRWRSYSGTAKNPLGMVILWASGAPGPIAVLNEDLLAKYVQKIDDRQKRDLYDLFASGNEDATDVKVHEINAQESK